MPALQILTFFVILFRRFIYDGTVLQTSKIKHPHTTVSSTAYKDVNAICAESNIEDFFIMRDELCFRCKGWDIPYRTSGVNARGDNQTWRQSIPIKGCERCCMFG